MKENTIKENMPKPEIIDLKCTFSQEGNTLGTTDEYEEIEISLSFQGDEDEGPFYVIKTKTGWSFDDISELKEIIDRVEKVLNKE